MKIVDLVQNTKKWIEFRRMRIGASDAPIIMDSSPWCTPFQLWERKLGFSPEQSESYAMAEGKRYEEAARESFSESQDMSFIPMVGIHDDHEWMIASFDGISPTNKIVEIKCPGILDLESAKKGVIPKKYQYQLQHQIAVSGVEMMYYYSFDKSCGTGTTIEVKRNQKMIDKMIEEEIKFLKCLHSFIPPDLSERDYNCRNDNAWKFAARNWKSASEKAKIYKEEEEQARKLLIESCYNMNSKGEGVKVQKIMRKGSVNYSNIKELSDINLDDYRSDPIQTWRIVPDSQSTDNTDYTHV